MTLPQALLLLSTVLLLAFGQILFKLASQDLVLTPVGIASSLINLKLASALIIYAIATLLWLVSLKQLPLSLAYPFVAMTFFVVPIFAQLILNEPVGWNTYVGAGIIAIGVIVSVAR